MTAKPRVIILAAGRGTRLGSLTTARPKALVPLLGRPLLEHQLAALRFAGLGDVTVVTGHARGAVEAIAAETVFNPAYAETNMVASLMCARTRLDGAGDALVAYSDIVYEPRLLDALLSAEGPAATCVDTAWRGLWEARSDDPLADAETLRLDGEGGIVEIGRKPSSFSEIEGQYVGLTLFRAGSHGRLLRCYDSLPADLRARIDFTSFLQRLIDSGLPLRAALTAGGWLEVDTASDLQRYERMASEGTLGRFWTPVA